MHLFRSTGVMRAACQEGNLGNVGGPSRVRGSDLQRSYGFRSGRESERDILPVKPRKRDGGKVPYFWSAFEGNERG